MPTRRQIIQRSAVAAALLALGPLLPSLVRAAAGLRRRAIPSTGEMLPVIGLGTSITHNVSLDDPRMDRLLEVLRVLVEGGGSLIDTAPSYGNAERVVGELVERLGQRGQVFLASKVSSTGRERGMAQIESSFEALQTDTIDLMQVHNLIDTRNQLALLRDLKRQGLTRYIGITHYTDRDSQTLAAVAPRRYFCTQCHVPQQDVKPLVENRFQNIDELLYREISPSSHGN